jgi:hypothetical protein
MNLGHIKRHVDADEENMNYVTSVLQYEGSKTIKKLNKKKQKKEGAQTLKNRSKKYYNLHNL